MNGVVIMDEEQTHVLCDEGESGSSERTHVLSELIGETPETAGSGRAQGSRLLSAMLPKELSDDLSRRAEASGMNRSEYARRIIAMGWRVLKDGGKRLCAKGYTTSDGMPFDPSAPPSRNAVRFILRVDRTASEAISGLAKEAGTSRAGALRALVRLPIVFRFGDFGISDDASQTHVITDSGLCELSFQIRKIGVNYNQIARALNVLARGELDPEGDERGSREDALAILRAAARANEGVRAELAKLSEMEQIVRERYLSPEARDPLARRLGTREGGE